MKTDAFVSVTCLDELLALYGEKFIYAAYFNVLGRAPDAEGLRYYAARLRSGIGKMEILYQLYRSDEVKQHATKICDLHKKMRQYHWLRMPLIGTLIRLAYPGHQKQSTQAVQRMEMILQALDMRVQEKLDGLDSNVRSLHSLVGSRANQVAASNSQLAPAAPLPVNPTAAAIRPDYGVDTEWYLQQYPEVAGMNMSPQEHFETRGRFEGRHPRFDAEWYLQQYPDVAAGGEDPRAHFDRVGKLEGRHPGFDPIWYQTEYPDVVALNIDPIEHFLKHGNAEGRFPAFDRTFYLERYPDVRLSGGDPLEHYCAFGKHEGRHPTRTPASERNNYAKWIRLYDTLTDDKRKLLRTRSKTFAKRPLISFVMPVYNPNVEWLQEAIESIQAQLYEHWELCIADDASPNPEVAKLLKKMAAADKRIKLVIREKNGHISAASNSALEVSTGEWIALIDHDDLIPEHALYYVVEAINKDPACRMIYSDEDKINETNERCEPYFKCDWNPDLFYSQNMFSHLGVYHADLIREVEGFRVGLEGSQDYDLALRCIERISPAQVHHIPRVLYHWRVHAESTAKSGDAKPYAVIAGERALKEHFERIGVAATTKSFAHGYRTTYALPENLPLVTLIIPTRNGLALLKQCVDSILNKTSYPNYEVLIMDNGSDEPATLKYLDALKKHAKVRVIRDDSPFNYSKLNNDAVKAARGAVVGLLNNDVEVVNADWLTEMVSHAMRPEVGAVGARLWYPDDTLQHGGVIIGIGGVANHAHKHFKKNDVGYFGRAVLTQSLSAVTAACLIIRKDVYQEVGGLNEKDLHVAFNDVDFCLRVRDAGYRNIWTPYAELYHHESATRGMEDTPVKKARFEKEVLYMKKFWGDSLNYDPAYSPNLTFELEDFSFAWPPRINGADGLPLVNL
jgi:GT2 family glycosyltransferase